VTPADFARLKNMLYPVSDCYYRIFKYNDTQAYCTTQLQSLIELLCLKLNNLFVFSENA